MKRVWDVADFADHLGEGFEGPQGHRRARRLLKRLDEKHGGKLLIPSKGANREYTFLVATLARLEHELFEPVESLELRLEAVEERVDELSVDQRRIAAQTGHNTREIARMRRSGCAA